MQYQAEPRDQRLALSCQTEDQKSSNKSFFSLEKENPEFKPWTKKCGEEKNRFSINRINKKGKNLCLESETDTINPIRLVNTTYSLVLH